MFEMITAIALWCGQPTAAGAFAYPIFTKKEVQECRDRLKKCLNYNYLGMEHKKIEKCFEQEKLK